MNGGQIYFPAGTPDPSDVVDGKVDVDASARRELLEETGVRAEETVVGPTWTVVFAGWRIACIKPMTLPLSADKVKARIEAFLVREALPELTRMHIARRASDIDEACMPIFVSAYLPRRSKAARATFEDPLSVLLRRSLFASCWPPSTLSVPGP
jgi:hypothetical protein